MERCLNPHTKVWDGEHADYTPQSDDIPWCMVPEKKITVEDVKYVLSSHFQGTPYDPYAAYGEKNMRGAYRSIGINRNDFLAVIQMRPGMEHDCNVIEWIAFASMRLMYWFRFTQISMRHRTISATPQGRFPRTIFTGQAG